MTKTTNITQDDVRQRTMLLDTFHALLRRLYDPTWMGDFDAALNAAEQAIGLVRNERRKVMPLAASTLEETPGQRQVFELASHAGAIAP
jgi:hypothetical protein